MNEHFSRMIGMHLVSDEAKQDRWVLRDRVIFWFVVFVFLCPLLYVGLAHAGPTAQAVTEKGERIVLTDELCKMDAVSNLKYRATWHEKGKVYEGCYGMHPYGVILAYWADKTVTILPIEIFEKVSGA